MKKRTVIALIVLVVLTAGLLVPQQFSMPVTGATSKDYHPDSFWYYPWGRSVTHKGVDIFAREGTVLHTATPGLVVYCGTIQMGGNVVLVLGPKWRFHYYAHMQTIETSTFSWLKHKERIGTVGTTGNAKGKSPHLHYSILTPLPYVWRIDNSKQGWLKMFYLNPIDYLKPKTTQ